MAGFEYPRSDLAPTVRFVGPILTPPAQSYEGPSWWPELGAGRPVVHVTQGTLDNADLGRLLLVTTRAWRATTCSSSPPRAGPTPNRCDGVPANVRLERFVPHDLLLPRVDVWSPTAATAASSRRWPTASPSWSPVTVRTSPRWRPAAVVGHGDQPAHGPALAGHGGFRRAPDPPPQLLPATGAGAPGRDRRHRPAAHHQRALAELCAANDAVRQADTT